MRLLGLAPWRRGPLLLARRPGVAIALFAAAAVAALPAAAAPLFLSSAEHATLHRQIDETCPGLVGAQFTGMLAPTNPLTFVGTLGPESVVGVQRYEQRQQVLSAEPIAGLVGPTSAAYGDLSAVPVDRPPPLPDQTGIRLLTRDEFADKVEIVDGPVGDGIWLPHEHAERQGLAVGDELVLTARAPVSELGNWVPPSVANVAERPLQRGPLIEVPDPEPARVPVAAIYRDLRTLPESGSWCGFSDGYLGTRDERNNPNVSILPMALIDTESFMAVGESTRMPARHYMEFALADPRLDAPTAARIGADVDALRKRMFNEHLLLFPKAFADDTEFVSRIDRYQQRAALVQTGLLPPVLPITAAGALVGLAVAAAAAVFWSQRRHRELTVLAAHGVSAGGLGVKAVAEALPAVVAGTAAGWAAAWVLVSTVGPAATLAPGTRTVAAVSATVIGLVALVIIGGLAAIRARALADTRPIGHGRRWWSRVPWELALLGAAVPAWFMLDAGKVVDTAAGGVGEVAHVPARLLVAPILAILGGAAFGCRLVAGWLRRRGQRGATGRPAALLAWRRAARAAVATAILAAATAVPVAMATFGATATGTVNTTADAKLRFNLGSDTVVTYPRATLRDLDDLPPPPPIPATLAGHTAEVQRLGQQRLDGLTVDVLAVDPDNFLDGAFWDDRIAGPTLREAVESLRADSPATIVASRRIATGPATLTMREVELPVEVVATRPLPGAQAAYPMVLVHQDLINGLPDRVRDTFTPQWWIAGEPAATAQAIADADLPVARMVTIDEHRAGAVYEPVTFTFQYLLALSVFTGLIGAVGLLLYLESRTAAHRRGYAMLRRLGLRARTHRLALLLEVTAPVTAGLLAGLAGAVAVAYVLRGGFDVNPDRFPEALLDLPGTLTLLIIGTAAVLATGAGLLAHARVSRANPAEVLRDSA